MKQSKVNFIVDALAFFFLVLLISSGLVMRFLLPPGGGEAGPARLALWGMSRHEWGDGHFYLAMALMAVLAFHLVLHWRWVVAVGAGEGRQAPRLWLGALAMITLFAVALSPFFGSVEKKPPAHRQGRAGGQAGPAMHSPPEVSAPEPAGGETHSGRAARKENSVFIRGGMTLVEFEEATGMPAVALLARLGIVGDVDPEEKLGRLARRHGFTLDDVRKIAGERGGE